MVDIPTQASLLGSLLYCSCDSKAFGEFGFTKRQLNVVVALSTLEMGD
jgi:hypothetical protein